MIKKRLKTIVILLVAAVVLLAAYLIAKPFVFDEREAEQALYDEDGDALGNGGRPYIFNPIEFENVKSIYVNNSFGEYCFVMDSVSKSLVLEGKEMLSFNVELLSYLYVNACEPLAMAKLEDASSDLSEYGLAGGVSKQYYTVTDTEGNRNTVYIGDLIPTGAGYYCKNADKPHVYIVSTLIDTNVLASVNDYIVPMIAPPISTNDVYNVENLQIVHDGELLVSFEKATAEIYNAQDGTARTHVMTYPAGYNASQDTLDAILEKLCGLTGSAVVESDIPEEEMNEILERYGFLNPSRELIYTLGGKENRAIFGNKTEDGTEYYALNLSQQTICTVPTADVEFIDYELIDFIDSFLFRMNIDSVASVELRTKKHHETFELTGEKNELSVIRSSDKESVDTNNFRQLYMDILMLALDDYADAPETPNEILAFTVTDRSGAAYEYRFYDLSTRKVFFTVNGVGQFCANRDTVERVINDVDKLIKGEKITSSVLA